VTRPSEKGAPSAPERIWVEVAAHQLYAGREQFWPSNIEYIRADAARPMIAEELEKHAQALRDQTEPLKRLAFALEFERAARWLRRERGDEGSTKEEP